MITDSEVNNVILIFERLPFSHTGICNPENKMTFQKYFGRVRTITPVLEETSKMDLPQLSIPPGQILLGLLTVTITVGGSLWIYRRSKRDEEIRWRIENIYETGLDEVNAVIDDDEYPGTPRNRQDESFWDDVSYMEQIRIGPSLIRKGRQYYRLFGDLEKAERKFVPLNQDIMDEFPDDIVQAERTRVQLLVSGTAEFEETESHSEDSPKALMLSTWAGIESVFADRDVEILDADSPQELREYLIPEEGLEEYPYPDEPTIFMGGFRPEYLSFWENEFSEWDECLYRIVDEGYVEEYLGACKAEYEAQEAVKDAAREVRDIMTEEISKLNTEK